MNNFKQIIKQRKKYKTSLSNHEWCMLYDLIYRNSYLYSNLNMVPIFYKEFYKDIEKAAFNGNLIAIKYLMYLDEKKKEKEKFKQNLFKYLEIPIKEKIYRQVGTIPIETGHLKLSFKEIKEGDIVQIEYMEYDEGIWEKKERKMNDNRY